MTIAINTADLPAGLKARLLRNITDYLDGDDDLRTAVVRAAEAIEEEALAAGWSAEGARWLGLGTATLGAELATEAALELAHAGGRPS